jgi:hypothetical protein
MRASFVSLQQAAPDADPGEPALPSRRVLIIRRLVALVGLPNCKYDKYSNRAEGEWKHEPSWHNRFL